MTRAGGGGRLVNVLYHPHMRRHASFIRGELHARKDSNAVPNYAAHLRQYPLSINVNLWPKSQMWRWSLFGDCQSVRIYCKLIPNWIKSTPLGILFYHGKLVVVPNVTATIRPSSITWEQWKGICMYRKEWYTQYYCRQETRNIETTKVLCGGSRI